MHTLHICVFLFDLCRWRYREQWRSPSWMCVCYNGTLINTMAFFILIFFILEKNDDKGYLIPNTAAKMWRRCIVWWS